MNHFLIKLICMGVLFFLKFGDAYAVNNVAYGKRYTLTPMPNYPLTADVGDEVQLTDGEKSSGRLWTTKKSVGWKDSGLIEIEIDLENDYLIDKVCFSIVRSSDSGISYPRSLDVLISLDRLQYRIATSFSIQNTTGEHKKRRICADDNVLNGRYVMLLIQPSGSRGFTFLDEVEVYSLDEKIERGNTRTINAPMISTYLKEKASFEKRKYSLLSLVEKIDTLKYEDLRVKKDKLLVALTQIRFASDANLNDYEKKIYRLNQERISTEISQPTLIWQKNPWLKFRSIEYQVKNELLRQGLRFDLVKKGSAYDSLVITNNTVVDKKIEISVEGEEVVSGTAIDLYEVGEVISALDYDQFGDALLPLENRALHIRPGESKQIFIEISSISDVAGIYRNNLIVSEFTEVDNNEYRIPVESEVLNLKIRQERRPNVNAWAYSNTPIAEIDQSSTISDLVKHQVNTVVYHPHQLPWPVFDDHGRVNDYKKEDFDKTSVLYEEMAMRLFFMNFNDKSVRSFNGRYTFLGRRWKEIFKVWIQNWVEVMKGNGLTYSEFAFYPFDEPSSNEEIEFLLEVARLIKEVDENVLIYTTKGRLDRVDLLRAKGLLDIIQTLVTDLDAITLSLARSMDIELWSYSAEGGGKAASPNEFYRAQSWKAFELGLTGVGFWAYGDTGPVGQAWDDFDGKRPDYAVVYEGNKKPISSKRWKAWKLGVEEFTLLRTYRNEIESEKIVDIVKAANDPTYGSKRFDHTMKFVLERLGRVVSE